MPSCRTSFRALGLVFASALVGGCLTARTDARVTPGKRFGVSSAVLYTPDAVGINDDGEYPDRDASDLHGDLEVYAAKGWDRFEFRWRFPVLLWSTRNDYSISRSPVMPLPALLGGPELYWQVVRSAPWHVGVGIAIPEAQLATTYELAPRRALTWTVRYRFVDRERYGDAEGVHTGYSGLVQAQVAYVVTGAGRDVTVFASYLQHVGYGGHLLPYLAMSPSFELMGYNLQFQTIALVGASVAWH